MTSRLSKYIKYEVMYTNLYGYFIVISVLPIRMSLCGLYGTDWQIEDIQIRRQQRSDVRKMVSRGEGSVLIRSRNLVTIDYRTVVSMGSISVYHKKGFLDGIIRIDFDRTKPSVALRDMTSKSVCYRRKPIPKIGLLKGGLESEELYFPQVEVWTVRKSP